MFRESARLVVRLDYLAKNLKLIQESNSDKEIIFMVKANAYGHGLLEITRFAYQNLKIKSFGVATLGEAVYLRQNIDQFQAQIYVFSENNLANPKNIQVYQELNIVPVIWNLEDFKRVIRTKIPLVLKFNTGMNRLGLNPSDMDLILSMLKKENKAVDHLMTHFSSASLPLKKGDRTHQQLQAFLEIKEKFKLNQITVHNSSIANSAAVEQNIESSETHIRPGLMCYGPSGMMKQSTWRGELISSLECNILHAYKAKKGTPIGYGGHILDQDSKVLYLPLGYGDGIPFHLSGFKFQLSSLEAKVLGRVNMDMMALQVPLDSDLTTGDELVLWDNQHNFKNWCAHQKTIPYEVLCNIGHRLPRFYRLQ